MWTWKPVKHSTVLLNQGYKHKHTRTHQSLTLIPDSNLVCPHKLMGELRKLQSLIPELNSESKLNLFCYVALYLSNLTQFAPPHTERERERNMGCRHGELLIHNHSECVSHPGLIHIYILLVLVYTHACTHTRMFDGLKEYLLQDSEWFSWIHTACGLNDVALPILFYDQWSGCVVFGESWVWSHRELMIVWRAGVNSSQLHSWNVHARV